MRSSGFIFLIGILFITITDSLLFLQIKKYLCSRAKILAYWIHSLFFIAGLITYHMVVPNLKGPEAYYWIATGVAILFLFYIPKIVFIVINGIALLSGFLSKMLSGILRKIALIIAIFLFIVILHGITLGRYNYKTDTLEVCLKPLPDAFNGLKIVQLSDIHLGSYSRYYNGIPELVEKVNKLQPDLILFTGDMVNNFADEMKPWLETLGQLKAKYGKYAVTGNHDYGDYTRWNSPEEKRRNMDNFYQNMEKIGFTMLNNTNIPLIIGQDTLYFAGVENWGNPPFPRYGNLSQAIDSLNNQLVILLSHDPSHWRGEVLDHKNIGLTLSGHTHAMQMGIRLGNWEWSPAQYIYPEYDGLYQKDQQYLHVSRGQGYLGFPGRIGLRPVISQIILTNKCQ